jgi:hypothetical protein
MFIEELTNAWPSHRSGSVTGSAREADQAFGADGECLEHIRAPVMHQLPT